MQIQAADTLRHLLQPIRQIPQARQWLLGGALYLALTLLIDQSANKTTSANPIITNITTSIRLHFKYNLALGITGLIVGAILTIRQYIMKSRGATTQGQPNFAKQRQ